MFKAKVHFENGTTDRSAVTRTGMAIYLHPKMRFVTLEFHGRLGTYRESYRPDQIKKVGA